MKISHVSTRKVIWRKTPPSEEAESLPSKKMRRKKKEEKTNAHKTRKGSGRQKPPTRVLIARGNTVVQ